MVIMVTGIDEGGVAKHVASADQCAAARNIDRVIPQSGIERGSITQRQVNPNRVSDKNGVGQCN